MKKLILAFAVLLTAALFSGAPASAETYYEWCALYSSPIDSTNCGFSTLAQCRATVSGVGGQCHKNLAVPGSRRAYSASAYERPLNLWNLDIDKQYPWCALFYGANDTTSCSFSTLAQCRATVSGVGGRCYENPVYAAPVKSRPHRRAARRKAH